MNEQVQALFHPGMIVPKMVRNEVKDQPHAVAGQLFAKCFERRVAAQGRGDLIFGDGIRRAGNFFVGKRWSRLLELGQLQTMRARSWPDAPNSHEPNVGEAEVAPQLELFIRNLGQRQFCASRSGECP